MTKRTRRRFTPEYKEQSVARLSEEGMSHASLAGESGVTSGQFKTWHIELLAAGSAAALAQSKAEAAELAHRPGTMNNPDVALFANWLVNQTGDRT